MIGTTSLDQPLWPVEHAFQGNLTCEQVEALEEEWKAAKIDEWCTASSLAHATADLQRAAGLPPEAPAPWALTRAEEKARGAGLAASRAGRAVRAYRAAASDYEGARVALTDIRTRAGVPDSA